MTGIGDSHAFMRLYLIALSMLGVERVKLRKSRGGHETLRFKIFQKLPYFYDIPKTLKSLTVHYIPGTYFAARPERKINKGFR